MGARAFYLFMAAFTFLIFGMYDNQLREAIINFNVLYVVPFFVLMGASYRLFVTCGSNPGFLDKNEKAILELQNKQTGNFDNVVRSISDFTQR